MRVLLVQTAQGLTPSSGGYKANISLLRTLSDQGHETGQICYAAEEEVAEFAARAEAKGIEPNITEATLTVINPPGVVHELGVMTFTDEDNIHNVAIARRPFNKVYPTREF
jgi:hypothetical protein